MKCASYTNYLSDAQRTEGLNGFREVVSFQLRIKLLILTDACRCLADALLRLPLLYWQTPIKKETGSELIARMIAEAPSSSLPRGADAIPYDELSDTEPEEKAAEGSPKKHPPSPACSNTTQQFCSSEPSSLEPSPTKPEPEPKPAYDGPAMRTRSKTKHA